MWSHGNTSPLVVGVQTCTATLKVKQAAVETDFQMILLPVTVLSVGSHADLTEFSLKPPQYTAVGKHTVFADIEHVVSSMGTLMLSSVFSAQRKT
ncbi:hypothetical protein STEG23_020595, partial [Scotinomys teguina]